MPMKKDDVINALRSVNEPTLHRDLVALNCVRNVAYCDGLASVRLALPTSSPAIRQQVSDAVQHAVRSLGDQIKQVTVEFVSDGPAQADGQSPAAGATARPPGAVGGQAAGQGQAPQGQGPGSNPLPDVKHIIAVGAGKGGVGKSTVAVNLAVGLVRAGRKVGLLDGDIYGPSLPTLLGLDELDPATLPGNMIKPFEIHGLKAMTLGKLVEAEKPLIWRGPMAHGAFRQLATQTAWGELDDLIIDLPPGTGDVPLTMSQILPLTGAVVVCTPQRVAQDDARRAVRMFEQLEIPVLGVVENMSYFIGDDGKEYDIFGRGGAQTMAKQMDVPFLGTIPINMRLRTHSDQGTPIQNFEGDAQLGAELTTVVENLLAQVSLRQQRSGAPTLTIS